MSKEIEISVIAPCFNEEENIDTLSKRMQSALETLGVSFELICVDDASTDQTKAAIQKAEKEYPFVKGVFHEKNQGIPGGWKSGYKAAEGKYIVTTDADLQYRPEDIPALYKTLHDTGADMVQGWRDRQVKRSAMRQFLTAGFSWVLNVFFGMKLHDNKSGFVICLRDVFGDLLNHKMNYYYFHHFITIAAIAKGYRIEEIPITFDERNAGESYIASPIAFSLKSAVDIPMAFWEYRLHKQTKAIER